MAIWERLGKPPEQALSLEERYYGFPEGLTYQAFTQQLPEVRKAILSTNPIIRTDTYNRTMEYLAGENAQVPATYVLQFRKASEGYVITAGIEDTVRNLANITITQSMLNFAKDYYAHATGVSYFNPQMWQEVIDKHQGKLPFTIDCLPDGSVALPSDPVLRISGPNELVAHFEPEIHQSFYPTLVATNANRIGRIIGPDRFIEVGLRGAQSDRDHLTALKAMYIGGGFTRTSNDEAFGYLPNFGLVGTIGHRKIQEFEEEEDAFRDAVEKLDNVTLLVDLNDAYHGIDMAIDLKKEYRATPKNIWIRLDSGDVGAQTLYALKKQQELGFLDSAKDKIVVEGIDDIEDIQRIETLVRDAGFDPEQLVLYGAGGLLISNHTTRSDASSAFKLSAYNGRATMKFSNSPGKESIPGQPTLIIHGGQRVIAQQGEFLDAKELFVRAYDHGTLLLKTTLGDARVHADLSLQQLQAHALEKSAHSPQTDMLIQDITRQRSRRGVEIYQHE